MPEPTKEQWEAILTLADREIKQSGLRKELIAKQLELDEVKAREATAREAAEQAGNTLINDAIYEFIPEVTAKQAAVDATLAALEASKVPGQIEP
jgi:hypothetical protein